VSAGHHTISLAYDDPTIGYGLLGSALVLLGMLGAALALRRRDAENRRDESPLGAE
jgi:hypothetical protein